MPQPETAAQASGWDGLPLNPDVSGWHWLSGFGAHGMSPWYWDAGDELWDTDDDHCHAANMARCCSYICPCPYPERNHDV